MLVQDRFQIENGVLTKYLADTETEIAVPEGVHTIGEGVFKGMSWLTAVTLPASLKTIGPSAFKGCRKLTGFAFPEGLEEIGEYAFHKCHGLRELCFPKTVTRVDSCAFLYCDSLEKAVLEGPERLGGGVFSHNLRLREVSLNGNLDTSNFSEEVFEGCIHLQKITLSGVTYQVGNLLEALDSRADWPPVIRSIARSVYHSMQIEDGVLTKFSINLKNVTVPEGITAIGKSCFFDKRGIVSIVLPNSLREIRANAFLNCIGLTDVTFPSPAVELDDRAFRGCCNLKRVHVSGETFSLEEAPGGLAGRIRDQVLGDFYLSGRVLLRYLGKEEQVPIPRGVEIIGERCFFGNEQLKTVLCPDSLREIREEAFAGCPALLNVVLGSGLVRVEREAFAECKKLRKCNLPETTEYIGEYAFRRCFQLRPFDPWPAAAAIHPYAFFRASQLPQPERPFREPEPAAEPEGETVAAYARAGNGEVRVLHLSGVRRIGKYAFAACPNLEEIDIDAPDCVVEHHAFTACPKLRRVRLHVGELGKGAFSYCRSLTDVRLSGVSLLPAECFAGCSSLRGLEAAGLTAMEARCFDECVGLDDFDFSKIRVIGERAFERCEALKSVKLDQTEVGYHAFADCAGLESVALTKNTVLKSGAFIGCTQVRTIAADGGSYEFSRFSDCLNRTGNPYPALVREVIASIYACFDIRERTILAGYTQDAGKVTLPRDLAEVGPDVFRDHIRLREIDIPESVRRFGSHAFSQTGWLAEQRKQSEMVIVNQILLDGALCRGRVVLPPTVRRVSSWCFAGNTEITELVIPSERIGIEALSFRNCMNLKRITDWNGNTYVLTRVSDLRAGRYPDLVQRIFSECINCFKLDEGDNLIESTGNIPNLTFPEGIRAVGSGVYKDCHLLETIALSPDTERIEKSAFENSKWLRSVTRAGAVAYLGAMAFSGCQSLETIDLSDELREMGSRCFEHCGSLREVHISNRLEKIPKRAFFRCKSLRRVTIPPSVQVIEEETFAFCENLEEVTLPAETRLGERAFAWCGRVKLVRTGGQP